MIAKEDASQIARSEQQTHDSAQKKPESSQNSTSELATHTQITITQAEVVAINANEKGVCTI